MPSERCEGVIRRDKGRGRVMTEDGYLAKEMSRSAVKRLRGFADDAIDRFSEVVEVMCVETCH